MAIQFSIFVSQIPVYIIIGTYYIFMNYVSIDRCDSFENTNLYINSKMNEIIHGEQ